MDSKGCGERGEDHRHQNRQDRQNPRLPGLFEHSPM